MQPQPTGHLLAPRVVVGQTLPIYDKAPAISMNDPHLTGEQTAKYAEKT